MANTFSGKEVVRILCRAFGFVFVSQRGSHVKLRKRVGGRIITTIVPMHKELARGTLLGALELAEVDEEDFRKAA
ncbi:MAG: type II toxin-antitoxin system HicA family toxin [Candidatus Harrisonbacteria bacterium]|nr:type II toxin-antitoxin system HicA family toxin [Candidatus Harrisonbacteria bacterium]MBI2406216.1 type II toxin-antitoxin system HicA family toxin [Candidatus Harrisonbacteria bacterium]MBI2603943.1 type II toxin-antitoxin system HicA family toxin [Candidatus Harrisonbacteria bacterium]